MVAGCSLRPTRGPWARRFRDLCELHADDLGGASRLSEAQLSLIRRAATLEVELERLEGLLATGAEDVALDSYGRGTNTLRRLLESLGLERKAKNITPTLAEYLAARDAEHAAKADAEAAEA